MALQENLMPNGWPLGLENMNTRLLEAADNSPQAAVAALEPSSLRVPSSSFSSFSSSNLDTESTVSFFADHSVTLGRLIGLNPRAREACAAQTQHKQRRSKNRVALSP